MLENKQLKEINSASVQASNAIALGALNIQTSCNANLVPLRTNSSGRTGFSAGTLKKIIYLYCIYSNAARSLTIVFIIAEFRFVYRECACERLKDAVV